MKAAMKEVSDPKFLERMSFFQCVTMGVSMSKTDERKRLARGYKKVMKQAGNHDTNNEMRSSIVAQRIEHSRNESLPSVSNTKMDHITSKELSMLASKPLIDFDK